MKRVREVLARVPAVTVPPGRAAAAAGKRASLLTVLLALLAMLLTACSHASASTSGAMRLGDCGGNPQAAPRLVVVVCSDSAITARDVKWSGWGSKIATGTGSAVVNVCAFSDCHTGSYRPYPIVLVASGSQRCSRGVRGYARIQYLFVGRSPFQGLPAFMKVPSTFWGPYGVGSPTVPRPCH